MRSRGLVVAIAVVLAVLAAAGVIVYTSNLEDSITKENTVSVIVSSQDIAANTDLDPLLSQGLFTPIQVPIEAQVAGAVTSLDQLVGQTTAAPIFAKEQIPTSRLASSGGGNQYGITPGNVGLGLAVAGPESVNGGITQGSHIVVYATFPRGTAVSDNTLERLLTPAQIQRFYEAVVGGGATSPAQAPVLVLPVEFTATLIPSVSVLDIQNPPLDPNTGESTEGQSRMVLDLPPEDAQQLVFSLSTAQLYLGLLPPENEAGYETPASFGVPLSRVLGVAR